MALRTRKQANGPEKTPPGRQSMFRWRATPIEALLYMVAGAYVYQVGVWAYQGLRGERETPLLLPPTARVTASSLLRRTNGGPRPVADDAPNLGGSGAKPPPEPPVEPGAELSDRFSMLEIDE